MKTRPALGKAVEKSAVGSLKIIVPDVVETTENQGHTVGMADPVPPIAQARQNNDGSWFCHLTYSSSQTEHVNTFKTELEAKEWIRLTLQTWLEGQKARDKG